MLAQTIYVKFYKIMLSIFQVYQQVLSDQGRSLLDSLVASVTAEKSALENVKSERELTSIFQRIAGVRVLHNKCLGFYPL